jgi:succinyl-diaminopimelate desuccinylase
VIESGLVAKILEQIDADEIAANTLRLVGEFSPTGHEEAAARLYSKILNEYGLDTELQYVQPGRPNVLTRIKGDGLGQTLLFGGHIDTIFTEGCVSPQIKNGRVYGRGADDMKGSLASMAAAAAALKNSGVKLKGDLLVAAWVDHEDPEGTGKGPKDVASRIRAGNLKVDGAIITEGPFDSIAIAQGGCAGFTIQLRGRGGSPHTISCYLKSNPILWASMVVEDLYKMDQELESRRWHHLIPQRRSIQLGILHGGDFYNRLPEVVEIVGTIRWDPGEDFDGVEKNLRERLSQLERSIRHDLDPDANIKLELKLHRESSEINREDRLVQTVQAATGNVFGHTLPLTGWRIVADQPFFVRDAGIPAVYYGPFTEDDTTAHSDNESVSVEKLTKIAKVYAISALLFCGHSA